MKPFFSELASQWIYIISDTNFQTHNISAIVPLIEEGNNVAFIYNYTRIGDECIGGLKCHSNELLRAFVLALSKAIREEASMYGSISDEEWEIIRPSKQERRDGILNFMLEHLRKTSVCSKEYLKEISLTVFPIIDLLELYNLESQ